MAFAASICLVVAVVSIYKFFQLSPEKLYQKTFVNYHLSNPDNNQTIENKTIANLYYLKNYKSVIKESKKTLLPNDRNFLLIGLSHLQMNDAFNAIAAFRQIHPSGKYYQDAQFYLALAYLKNNDYDQAIGLMQQMKNNEKHIYRDHFSSSLLNNIRMLKWK